MNIRNIFFIILSVCVLAGMCVSCGGTTVAPTTQADAPANTTTTERGLLWRVWYGSFESILIKASEQLLKTIPDNSKIAIVYITAKDESMKDYIAGELEYIWVNKGYSIIDRGELERVRGEQRFQMGGEVDDTTAVSIGKIAGADIIVTGRVDGEGDLRRLRLRALETQTARVVGVSSEKI